MYRSVSENYKMGVLNVQINTESTTKTLFNLNTPVTVNEIWRGVAQQTGISKQDFYIIHNGRLAHDNDACTEGYATIVPRLLGGKGGFGSMLRAIGAQIEKTTNREACRDLSGRRLRDINEEKRLKAWIEKQSKREEEAAERKKRKLQKLCAVPKHEFKDQNYERERSVLTERVGDAVEAGFKAAAGASGVKRKAEEGANSGKKRTLLDLDIDSDELDTSDDSDEDEAESGESNESNESNESKGKDGVEQRVSNDSGHSSDESDKASKSGAAESDSVSSNDKDARVTVEDAASKPEATLKKPEESESKTATDPESSREPEESNDETLNENSTPDKEAVAIV